MENQLLRVDEEAHAASALAEKWKNAAQDAARALAAAPASSSSAPSASSSASAPTRSPHLDIECISGEEERKFPDGERNEDAVILQRGMVWNQSGAGVSTSGNLSKPHIIYSKFIAAKKPSAPQLERILMIEIVTGYLDHVQAKYFLLETFVVRVVIAVSRLGRKLKGDVTNYLISRRDAAVKSLNPPEEELKRAPTPELLHKLFSANADAPQDFGMIAVLAEMASVSVGFDVLRAMHAGWLQRMVSPCGAAITVAQITEAVYECYGERTVIIAKSGDKKRNTQQLKPGCYMRLCQLRFMQEGTRIVNGMSRVKNTPQDLAGQYVKLVEEACCTNFDRKMRLDAIHSIIRKLEFRLEGRNLASL
jgi:hypothetical protein